MEEGEVAREGGKGRGVMRLKRKVRGGSEGG